MVRHQTAQLSGNGRTEKTATFLPFPLLNYNFGVTTVLKHERRDDGRSYLYGGDGKKHRNRGLCLENGQWPWSYE